MATGFAALVRVRARAARQVRDAALDEAVERFIQRRGGPNKIDGTWPGPAEVPMKKKTQSATSGGVPAGAGRSPSAGARPGDGGRHAAVSSGAPYLGVNGHSDGHTLREVLAARGIVFPGEDFACNRPRRPDPVLVAAQDRQVAEAQARETERAQRLGLGKRDLRGADPAEVEAAVRARGLGSDGFVADMFRRVPPQPPAAAPPSPAARFQAAADRRERTIARRARVLAERIRSGVPTDLRKVRDPEVVRRVTKALYGSYQA